MINRIEIEFAIPVEVEDVEVQQICNLVQRIAKRNQPEGHVHWQAGCGQKPRWSQEDAMFLGKAPDDNAPISGEPEWDDSVLHIETCCRVKYPDE